MSIENSIDALTKAVLGLTAALAAVQPAQPVAVAAPDTPYPTQPAKPAGAKASTEPAATRATAKPAEKPAKKTSSAASDTTQPVAAASAAEGPVYADVQAAVFALANAKGRDAVLAVLSEQFDGCVSAKALGEDQWPAAIAALEAALDAEGDDIA